MEGLINSLTANIGWVIGTILLFLAILGSLRYAASRYKKVPPSKVGIIYGRKQTYETTGPDGAVKQENLGFRLLTGGGSVVFPFVEDYAEMDLSARLIQLEVRKIPTLGGVMVNAKGTATVMIATDTSSIITAVRTFEGKKNEEINQIIRENLEGQLRSILGTLSIEELIGNREKLNEAVLKGAETELLKLGLRISILTIQEIYDEVGYIESLGKKRTAEVQGEATKGEAEARSRASIAASNATKEAELVAAGNQVMIAEAQKKRDVQIALFKAETEREQATADQAGSIAAAEADKTVRQRKVEAEAAETTARIQLADQETLRIEKELQFKVIKPAEANAKAAKIKAEGDKQAAVILAEQGKEAAALTAEATKTKANADAESTRVNGQAAADAAKAMRVGQADGEKAELLAKADGTKAQALADAEGKKASLLAEAEGKKANLLAEADGKEKLAQALSKLDATGRLLQVLDAAPKVAGALGDALAKALGPEGASNMFGQASQHLANIDSIKILDMGGNGNGLTKYANLGPDFVFGMLSRAKALGLDIPEVLERIGVKSELLDEFMGKTPANTEDPKQ